MVISQGHNDPPELAEFHLSEKEEKEARKAFRKPDKLPNILIVTEKLLTGFDAPILYSMYLDKPMRDHVLLQAIARVNRPYEEGDRRKPAGFVLDFVGIFENLEKALAFDSADVSGVIEDLDVLRQHFDTMMSQARTEYLGIGAGKVADKEAEAILEHFRDEARRDAFYKSYRELEELYEILSPDERLRPYIEDFARISAIYRLLRVSYEPHIAVEKSFLRKTAELVQARTHTGDILDPEQVYQLDEGVIEVLADPDTSDTVKVFNLVKVLEQEVRRRGKEAPYLIPIGQRAEHIAQLFHERQIDTEEALERLRALLEEAQQAEATRKESDFSIEAFSVFWLLSRQGASKPDAVARSMEQAFTTHPHWRQSAAQERQVRTALYKALIDAGAKDVSDLANTILDVLKR